MIISHKYRFIFIKTAKTAGTSIEVYLSQFCGPEDIVTPIFPKVEPHRPRNHESGGFYNHMTALELRDRLAPEIWSGYHKFCVERNPWDKTLSHYHMLKARAGGALSLEEYFRNRNFCVNYGLYMDEAGRRMVDQVLRYENLEGELGEVFNQLGVPYGGHLPVRAKAEFRLDRRPYCEVLSPGQREEIAEIFSKEIALWGYRY